MAINRAVLEVEQGAEPIRGWVVDDAGQRTPFYGWLDLARLVGALAAQERAPKANGPAPSGSEATLP